SRRCPTPDWTVHRPLQLPEAASGHRRPGAGGPVLQCGVGSEEGAASAGGGQCPGAGPARAAEKSLLLDRSGRRPAVQRPCRASRASRARRPDMTTTTVPVDKSAMVKPLIKVRRGRPPSSGPGGAELGKEASRQARRLAAMVLEVLAGARTPTEAAQALELCVPRYYQLESRALRGLLAACEPAPPG